MITDVSAFKNTYKANLSSPPFKYILPIPAGRNSELDLNIVSSLMVRDAHDFMVEGYAQNVVLLGSAWDSFRLKHKFNTTGAELRKSYLLRLNREYLNEKQGGRRIDDSQVIVVPRGLETIQKFIALRRILKESGEHEKPAIAVLAPDDAFGRRINFDADAFLDFGELGKHTVVVMHHEKELDDENREAREALILERTQQFYEKMGWMDTPQLRDELMYTVEEELVRSPAFQDFLGDCDYILEKLPVTGKESPYRGIETEQR